MSIAKYCYISKPSEFADLCYDTDNAGTFPFEVKRVYYILGTKPGVERGFHAHKELQQVAFCVTGSCRFRLDDGVNKEDVLLDTPEKGIILGDMLWHEMYEFSPDCIISVLASDVYDESDYIRDYDEFMKLVNK